MYGIYCTEAGGQYRIARKFGEELNLTVWRIDQQTAKLKSANVKLFYIFVWAARECDHKANRCVWPLGPADSVLGKLLITCAKGGHVTLSFLCRGWLANVTAFTE